MSLGELEKVGNGQAKELWDVQDLHLIGLHNSLLAHGQIPKMPDSHCVAFWKIGPNF